MLDFVPNHTSDQHLGLSRADLARKSERNWYIWRDPAADGGPPNNWISDFGGSAWEWDEITKQYYYHAFLREQPDLNWRHPAVQAAMYDVMRFWFDRGVDGFRIDVLWHMLKAEDFPKIRRTRTISPKWAKCIALLQIHSTDQPEVHQIAAKMRKIADSYGARERRASADRRDLPANRRLMRYYGGERPGVHLPFNFQLIDTPWVASSLAAQITDYEAALPAGGWPNWVLGNHDRPRSPPSVGQAQARVAAMLLLTCAARPRSTTGMNWA